MIKSNFLKKVNGWKRIAYLCVVLLSFCSTMALAQSTAITGTVTDESGEALIGVSVFVKGTPTIGASTNVNGAFSLSQVPPQSVLVFTYLGYVTQEIAVGNQTSINVRMREDARLLDEVVVVGYGVQKKALVTGATINVSGADIQRLSTSNPLTALQAQTPGVTIMQNNGQPGSDFIVNIRGIGTNGEARPLYVVDGVPSGFNALNNMNPSDIESIDILKDAASSAIYGSRAANGVVLVTTRQGKAGRPRVEYNGYWGKQYMTKKPGMLNAKEYMHVQDEISFNMGLPYYDWENLLPKHYPLIASGEWEGSDWVDAFYNKGAQTQSHAFNITGGNEMSRYSMGYSYMSQDGLLGAEAQSNNTRHTVRINSEHVILRVKDFDAIKFGENMNYVHRYRNGLAVGDRFSNSFSGVLTANPLLPIYNDTGENRGYYGYNDKQRDDWAFDENVGNPIGSTVLGTNGNNIRKSYNFNLSAYLQIQPIKNLILMSRYSYRYDSESRRQASFKSWFGRSPTTTESVRQDQEMGFNWMISNTLSYIFALNNHNFSVMVGQEVEKSGLGESVRADSRNNVFDLGFDYSWVDNMKATVLDEVYVGGGPRGINTLASFFGRVSYNLKETYMAEAVFRADGSSRFGPGNKWGYFPAFSAGWIISNESFMEDAKGTLDFLRVRAGWGQNGNQQIGGFQYLSRYLYTASGEYIFSDDKKTRSPGAIPGVLKNPNIKWETNENFGAGIDARFLRNRLSMSYEYYIRETKDWLLVAPISATWGFSEPYVNGGAVRNSGHELTLSWNDRAGDFNYSLNLNGSYNKNEVTRIENAEGIIRGPDHVISQTTTEIYRLQVGYPMGFWYGWVHEGIFQNWDEVGAHRDANGNLIQPTAQPGDVRFRDVNGDGMIDDGDKTFIGKAHPVYTSGFTGTLDYKGFDLIVTATGAFGHKIIKSYRSFASSNNANYTTEVFNRWTGEGTSDRWPRLTHGNNPNYQNISSLFLENANHVKIQNITIGYNFKQLFKAMPFSRFRAYVTGQNLFTFTKYPGMDPEVGYAPDGWARGVDIGLYPAAKTFLLGFDITF